MMSSRRIAGFLNSVRWRWWGKFRRGSLVGLPWFWPACPPGQHVMVQARRVVRLYFGRDHHPMHRKLAQVFVMLAWPVGVLVNLREARSMLGLEMGKRVPGALWAAI